jgi:hypothetical protein
MSKKITIVGKGTVGCMAAAHFLRWTSCDIEWVYDPSIPTTAVGEGTTLTTPKSLFSNLDWYWSDAQEIKATPKTGIYKENWGKSVDKFTHSFGLGQTGIHFNALEFQDKAFRQITESSRVNLVEDNVKDFENLDTDYVLVCSGTPKDKENLVIHKEIPVNTAYVTQCFWDSPNFTDTLTIARPYGWVFGIPLQNRCSIGYLYNSNINTLDEVKEDVKIIFERYGLKPSEITNHLSFNNYSRKTNFTDKVAYTGNASFFLEPLEASSTTVAEWFIRSSYDIVFGSMSTTVANKGYARDIEDVKSMICLHYMAGSKFDTPFWVQAKKAATKYIKNLYETSDVFAYNLVRSIDKQDIDRATYYYDTEGSEVGTWPSSSYRWNIKKLGIEKTLIDYELQREKYRAA